MDADFKRIYDLEQIKQSSDEKAVRTIFFDTDCTSAAIWVVRPGQHVELHRHPSSDDVWICLAGTGVFDGGDGKPVEVHPGMVLVSPRGVAHGFTNTGDVDFEYVSVVAPVPADYESLE